jgi:hypothetical protein
VCKFSKDELDYISPPEKKPLLHMTHHHTLPFFLCKLHTLSEWKKTANKKMPTTKKTNKNSDAKTRERLCLHFWGFVAEQFFRVCRGTAFRVSFVKLATNRVSKGRTLGKINRGREERMLQISEEKKTKGILETRNRPRGCPQILH